VTAGAIRTLANIARGSYADMRPAWALDSVKVEEPALQQGRERRRWLPEPSWPPYDGDLILTRAM